MTPAEKAKLTRLRHKNQELERCEGPTCKYRRYLNTSRCICGHCMCRHAIYLSENFGRTGHCKRCDCPYFSDDSWMTKAQLEKEIKHRETVKLLVADGTLPRLDEHATLFAWKKLYKGIQ